MNRAEGHLASRRIPSAAWAWEFLRRNPDYRADYESARDRLPRTEALPSGSVLYSAKHPDPIAHKWGLLFLADPSRPALEADVFWRPDLLAGALSVKLTPPATQHEADTPHDTIILSKLQTRRVMLQTVCGMRHILLNGKRFWIHLYSEKNAPPGDHAAIDIRLRGVTHMKRQIDTATQLLSLHRSAGGRLSLIGRRRDSPTVRNALAAYDIQHGFERPPGDLREIATAIVGPDRVALDWDADNRALKAQARRSLKRGEAFVAGGYRDFLARKSL